MRGGGSLDNRSGCGSGEDPHEVEHCRSIHAEDGRKGNARNDD